MPLFAILRSRFESLDIMMETADHQPPKYDVNDEAVAQLLRGSEAKVGELHAKHDRWRRLRQFLKLQKNIGSGARGEQRKIIADS